jgi:hypothetical protein
MANNLTNHYSIKHSAPYAWWLIVAGLTGWNEHQKQALGDIGRVSGNQLDFECPGLDGDAYSCSYIWWNNGDRCLYFLYFTGLLCNKLLPYWACMLCCFFARNPTAMA